MNPKNIIKRFLHRQKSEIKRINENIYFVKSKISGKGVFLPSTTNAIDNRQLVILHNGFDDHLYKKYIFPDISLKNVISIIDCGAFVGGFTIAMKLSGIEEVISIEPSSLNRKCLKLNLGLLDLDSTILPIGLGSQQENARLNLSASGCDNSILEPDQDDLKKSEEIHLDTIQNVVRKNKINQNNLLVKVEAEGFEPEIIDGFGDARPRYVVVDIAPERDGESPIETVRSKLISFGYNSFKENKQCLFCTYER